MNTDYEAVKCKELTEKIINIFYRVYNKLGYGFLEKIYENAISKIEVGLLLNFGHKPAIKRKIFDNFRK